MMHTKFSGSNGQNAHRWLRTLRYENPQITTISPSDWLGIVDGLLEGDAATWADHHPRVKHILRAGSLRAATRADVETFKKALIARFPPVEVAIGHSRQGVIISSPVLEQAPNEDLDSYYQRTLIFLYERNGVDLAEAPLTEQEHNALKKTVTSHIAGLTDNQIRREAKKVWTDSDASLSLHQIHKLSKDKKLLKWLAEEQDRMETRLPGQAARDRTPNRANAPGSSSDTAVFTSNMGNSGPFSNPQADSNNLPKPNNDKFATRAGDKLSTFIDLMKDHSNVNSETPTAGAGATSSFFGAPGSAEKAPTSKYRPFPELLPRKPTNATASTFYQMQNPPLDTAFTSHIGNSHHTPNNSNASNPPTTLPTASMFGDATGSPSRPRSSLFEESPQYSIFDARHPANKDRTFPAGYREAKRFFDSITGANNDNPPQHYSGMPPPGLSLFEPLTAAPNGSLFGNDIVTGVNHSSPPQHYPGMPPPGLSLFEPLTAAPNGSLFGNDIVTGVNHSSPPQHYPGIPPPGLSLFDSPPKKPNGSLFGGEPAPGRAAKGASPNRHSRRPSNLEVETHLPPSRLSEDTVRKFYSPGRNIFGNFSTQSPSDVPPTANPSNTTAANASTTTSHHHQGPSIQIQTPSIFDTPGTNFPVPEYRPTRNDSNAPSQVSMDEFTRQFTRLDTHPSPNPSSPPPHPNINPSPTSTSTSTHPPPPLPPSLPPLTYSQTLTATTAPPHPTVESDSDSDPEVEIPITIKQSQGRRKRGRRG